MIFYQAITKIMFYCGMSIIFWTFIKELKNICKLFFEKHIIMGEIRKLENNLRDNNNSINQLFLEVNVLRRQMDKKEDV